MRERKRFYTYGGPGIIVPGMFDSNYKIFHDRPEYTLEDARVVADWLNGRDRPLTDMVARAHDPRDPFLRELPFDGRGKP